MSRRRVNQSFSTSSLSRDKEIVESIKNCIRNKDADGAILLLGANPLSLQFKEYFFTLCLNDPELSQVSYYLAVGGNLPLGNKAHIIFQAENKINPEFPIFKLCVEQGIHDHARRLIRDHLRLNSNPYVEELLSQ